MITAMDLETHIAWAQAPGQRGDWTVRDDLILARVLCAGLGLTSAADLLGRSREDCRARWDRLMPEDARTLRLQEVLLRALGRSVEGVRL